MSNVFVRDGKVLVSKIKSTGDIKADVSSAVEHIGGWKKIIRGGETILLKPNYVFPNPPPATTALDFLVAVIELCKKAGAGRIIVGESAFQLSDTRRVMERLGAIKAIEAAGAEFHNFDKNKWVRTKVPGARYKKVTRYPKILDEVDRAIWLPCLKTHRHAGFSMSLKLSYGVTHKIERAGHFVHMEEKVAEANVIPKPDLIIMDGRLCFISGGPGQGEIRKPNLIFASGDRVAIDVEGLKTIQSYEGNSLGGINPWDMTTIKLAGQLGIGVKSEAEYGVLEG